MTPDLYAELAHWREHGEGSQQRFAADLLSLSPPPATSYVLPPSPESDADRAARLIAEFPPQPHERRCCNG